MTIVCTLCERVRAEKVSVWGRTEGTREMFGKSCSGRPLFVARTLMANRAGPFALRMYAEWNEHYIDNDTLVWGLWNKIGKTPNPQIGDYRFALCSGSIEDAMASENKKVSGDRIKFNPMDSREENANKNWSF